MSGETSDARKRREEREAEPVTVTDLDRLEMDVREAYVIRDHYFMVEPGRLLGLIGTLRSALAWEALALRNNDRLLEAAKAAEAKATRHYATALRWARFAGELAADRTSLEIAIEDLADEWDTPSGVYLPSCAHRLRALLPDAPKKEEEE